MSLRKYFFLLLLFPLIAFPQQQTTGLWQENLEVLAMETEDADWEDELEELSHLQEEPLNLNTATREQLKNFPFLSEEQIENLQAYIYLHGEMETLQELLLVEGMDRRAIEYLKPFVCVKKEEKKKKFPAWKEIGKYGTHELLTRFDQPFYTRKGYQDTYLGPKQYHSLRYQFRYGNYLQVGFSGEKDAGEPFFALHDNRGYDHYSYYLQLKGWGRLQQLVLGTYRLSFGQGLVLGNSFASGKSFSLLTSGYRATGIRKHSSTSEYDYFRGVAATVRLLPELNLSAFYSHRDMDGTVKSENITSIDKTGLHRTEKEVEKMNSFTQQLVGGNLTYEKNRLHVGVTGIYYFFDKPYKPNLRKYAKFNLQGNYFYNVGLDYQYRLGRFLWKGEVAKGKEGFAAVNQLSYRFSTDYRLLLIHRYYAEDYWAMFAHAFSESSTPQNENGWYLALEAAPLAYWRFFASVDMFSFPWWKYRISKSSQGVDGMLQVAFTPRGHWAMLLNYRLKRKERDVTGSSGELIYPTYHHRLRYRLEYASGEWKLRTTLDYNCFKQDNIESTHGYMATQMVTYTCSTIPLSATLQGAYFHADDYDSRVYSYEKGLLNTFYTPSYYGRGFRYTAHLRYDFGTHLMCILKFGQTIYQDREAIGSGNDLIAGNKKADLQLQLRVKF
ncbi:MAG: helix-hairpin-helix domain-containing protein [Bacteroides sp.]|nr:helix-hairpin-helix domain-containing protein [Bacteroides sp.]